MKWKLTLFLYALLTFMVNAENPKVILTTNYGNITIELNAEKAPDTVKNFLKYVDSKYYDGTIFHRVINNFMIQGGGFADGDPPAQKPTNPPIKNEGKKSGLSNTRGTISMARTNDPNSATSQFFINVVDNSKSLDPGGFSPDGYAVFGKVVEGMEFVDKIKAVETGSSELKTSVGIRPMGDVPKKKVFIKTITREKKKPAKK
ncbi:MAG: peptidylprolyl isomerase [Verrucomicrobiales bacterium]|jgi:cyclophilin family peptidyl-prolyl cis-trans isomerase|nr:peptidylprolyl isomerase [Verrucomicrobiales bacterium]